MSNDPPHKKFKTIRLRHFAYSETGAYSLTLVTHERQCLFGTVEDEEMYLSPYGEIVHEEWLRSAEIRPQIRLDEYVIMPNHIHAIVWIEDDLAEKSARSAALPRGSRERTPASVSSLMVGFKAATTRRIRESMGNPKLSVWQPRFHDHVIRSEAVLNALREYIQANPRNWNRDTENPDR
jgi:REP element-mobilizing transposase RayT